MDYKDGHLLALSAVVSVSCQPGGMFSSRKADWNKQFAPACLSSVAGTLSKEGPWLSLKYSFRLWGDKPVNSANKLFYPKSLRARGERKKKLKWNSSRLSTLWKLITWWSQRHLIKKVQIWWSSFILEAWDKSDLQGTHYKVIKIGW